MIDTKRRRSLEVGVTRYSLSSGKKTTLKLAETRKAHAADGLFQILIIEGEKTDTSDGVVFLTASVDGKTGANLSVDMLYRIWVWFTLHLYKQAVNAVAEGNNIRKFCGMVLSYLGLETEAGPGVPGPVVVESKMGVFEATTPDASSEP